MRRPKYHILTTIFLIIALLCVAGCTQSDKGNSQGGSGGANEKKINIVATTTMLRDLAEEIGKENVRVEGLMKPGVDPHLYQATAGDVEKMNKADVVLINGVHLEGKMGAIFENLSKGHKTVIRVSDALPQESLLDFEEGSESVKDPHIWFSIENWKLAADEVAKGLAVKDPAHKDEYMNRAKQYKLKLDELQKEVKEKVQMVPPEARVLVTAHDAFAYFARDNGFTVKGIQGISTDSEAATSDINDLAKFIASHKIKAIFVESSVPHKTMEALQAAVKAEGFDVHVGGELYSDSLGEEGTPEGTYIGMYRKNVDTIVNALK